MRSSFAGAANWRRNGVGGVKIIPRGGAFRPIQSMGDWGGVGWRLIAPRGSRGAHVHIKTFQRGRGFQYFTTPHNILLRLCRSR
eukprot:8876736-Pyramimonas_sp.AAC.1